MAVVTMQTRLFVPFTWSVRGESLDPSRLMEAWLARRVKDRHVRTHRREVWKAGSSTSLARGADLAPQVKDLLGLQEDGVRGRFEVRRLTLTTHARQLVFGEERRVDPDTGDAPAPGVMLKANRSERTFDAWVERVEAAVLPLGDGYLLVDLAWDTRGLDAPGACDALDAVRHVRGRKGVGDWVFSSADREPPSHPAALDQWTAGSEEVDRDWAGLDGVRRGGAVQFSAVVNWLLRADEEEVDASVARGDARPCSAIVLDGPLPPEERRQVAFWLRRGFNSNYGDPGELMPEEAELRVRSNRVITMSREACASLAWDDGTRTTAFEQAGFPERFVSQYAEVWLLSLVEHHGLARFGASASELVDRIRHGGLSTRQQAEENRDALRALAVEILHYITVMSWDDIGGLTDHVAIHRTQRRLWDLGARRDELRAEVQGLLALADASYRDLKIIEHAQDVARDRRFQQTVALLGAVAVPVSVITGLLGIVYHPEKEFMKFAAVGGVALLLGVALGWLLLREEPEA